MRKLTVTGSACLLTAMVYLLSYHPFLALVKQFPSIHAPAAWAFFGPASQFCATDPYFEPMQHWAGVWDVDRRCVHPPRNRIRQIELALHHYRSPELSLTGSNEDAFAQMAFVVVHHSDISGCGERNQSAPVAQR